jgi:hypothetical protein
MDPRSERIATMFASLADHEKVDAILDELYAPECVFSDPIQTVEGIEEIRAMNRRLERRLGDVDVDVLGDAVADNTLALRWVMTFKPWFLPGRGELEGVSWIEIGPDGKFVRHTDFWDMAALTEDIAPFMRPFHHVIRRLAG